MSKKKVKKKNAGPPKPKIRISQCMIVKNEEKNIEKALGWAKSVAYEQIVVDTGSSDKTVEIAKRMGARVYHFEWINDFAAAKNYAIEQAEGNWIAFLDADEYLTDEGAKTMAALLKKLYNEPEMREKNLAVNCPWVQLDDQGTAFAVDDQIRLFRNVPSIRYVGKIHEKLSLVAENVVRTNDISIMHTGYSRTSYQETDKAERNLELLRRELAERPDDLDLKVYLADSLRAKAREDGPVEGVVSENEAAALYAEVAGSTGIIDAMLNKKAHLYTVDKSVMSGKTVWECEKICDRALSAFPDDIDFMYYLAMIMNRKGDFLKAKGLLEKCEEKLVKATSIYESDLVAVKPMLMYHEKVIASEGLGDTAGCIKYATMILMEDKTQQEILRPYIATMINHGTSEDDLMGLLGKMYDINDPSDLVLIARAAKDCGAISFAKFTANMAKRAMEKRE